MNAAARAMVQNTIKINDIHRFSFSTYNILMGSLLLAVLVTAFTLVSVKDLNRRLFSDLQSLQQTRDSLQIEWSQLLLEQNTWSSQARIQEISQSNMDMIIPTSSIVINAK
ncbi:MAG: Cell division protein FtsL [Legionellaceae bacterium]